MKTTSSELREALVQTTIELLRDRSPGEISMRDLARRLGVSSGAPFHHFEDRSALLAAVALDGWRQVQAEMDAVRGATPRERLRGLGQAYLGFALSHPEHYRTMFLPELKDPVRFADVHAMSLRGFALLVGVVAEARGRRPDDPEVLARVLACWSTVHGFALLASGRIFEGKLDHLGQRGMIDAAVDGAIRAGLGD